MPTPEAQAREKIDEQLTAAGWVVQDYKQFNPSAGRGIALREAALKGQQQIKNNVSATTLPILNKSKFEALSFPIPPLAEQMRIVAEVERRLSVVEELETVVNANLQRATRLRQSILNQAFSANILKTAP